MRWLPANHPWVGQGDGVRIVGEDVSSALGGEHNVNGTHYTIPPGLVHTQLKQWGRLQWWHSDVIKEPGMYNQNDVEALNRKVRAASIQRANSSKGR